MENRATRQKICVFCAIWGSGGIESFLFNTLSRMDLSEISVDIVAEQIRESVFTAPLERLGVRFIELSGTLFRVLTNHRLFKKLLTQENYSVLHLNIYQGMSSCYCFFGKRAGISKRIIHSHNSDLRESRLRAVKLLLHKTYSRAFSSAGTDFWACSGLAARFMFPPKLLKERGYVFLPNGINTTRFRFNAARRGSVRAELGLEGKFVIGNVGRLCFQKNQLFLIDVLALALRERPDCFLLLVGEGPDREAILEKARLLGVEKQLLLYGVSPRVEELLCAMDLFALPSVFEGLPISVVEAQASGLPVLCHSELAHEACILKDRFTMLPLDPERWAAAVAAAEGRDGRDAAAELVRSAGFDISAPAQYLQTEYSTCGKSADGIFPRFYGIL